MRTGSAEWRKGWATAEVDEAFLEEIECWREALAKNIILRNEEISDRELNYSVQLIIDRRRRRLAALFARPNGGLRDLT